MSLHAILHGIAYTILGLLALWVFGVAALIAIPSAFYLVRLLLS